MVRRDGDVACGLQGLSPLPGAVEAEGDAPRFVYPDDDERRGFDELEFELTASGVGATGAKRCVDLLEHDSLPGLPTSFSTSPSPQAPHAKKSKFLANQIGR